MRPATCSSCACFRSSSRNLVVAKAYHGMAFDVSVGLGTWAEHQGQEQPQAHPYEESMENMGRLLLDSRGVDLTIAYNAIFASHRLLDGLIFQGFTQDLRVADAHLSIRPWNPTKSHSGSRSHASARPSRRWRKRRPQRGMQRACVRDTGIINLCSAQGHDPSPGARRERHADTQRSRRFRG